MPLLKDANQYGGKYQDHLLEQYRLYVEMADHISDRRDKTNSFFLAVNTALLTAMGLILSSQGGSLLLAAAPILPALILCFYWMRLIGSYRQLNSAKYQVIGELERALSSAPYAHEWELLGQGKDPTKYRPLTHVEEYVPKVFMLLYVALALVALRTRPETKEPTRLEVSGRLDLPGSGPRATSEAPVPGPVHPAPVLTPYPSSAPTSSASADAGSH